MNSNDLTREQLDPLCEKTRDMTAWLNQLKTRLEANRFPHDDELYKLACEACDKVQHLRMTLHYLNCETSRKQQPGHDLTH